MQIHPLPQKQRGKLRGLLPHKKLSKLDFQKICAACVNDGAVLKMKTER